MSVSDKQPLAVYIHWGFCRRKCPYCDFMSRKIPNDIDFDLWLAEYKKAFDFYTASADSRDFYVSSIFFGGGTPSLLPPAFIENFIKYIKDKYGFANDIEISLEANPYKLTRQHLSDLKAAGINRLSLGVQSFDDKELRFLGRLHDSREALAALENTAEIFENFSFDLIYALPEQTPDSWEKSLSFALSFSSPHLSLYQLTIEAPSAFYRRGTQAAADDIALALYNLTLDMTQAEGIPAYEVSNHAKRGFESRHNLAYWRYKSYIGTGPSAHGRITTNKQTFATKEKQTPLLWFKAKKKNQYLTALTAEEVREEKILMGMRLREGINKNLANPAFLSELTNDNLIEITNNQIKATRKGLFVLNSVIERLI